jgi:3-deoxy-7-phosphoheptulonate synthase / chorismate mutase
MLSRLAELRGEIDEVNRSLLELLQRRGGIVLEISRLKQAQGLDGYDPSREEEMLHTLLASCGGPYGASEITAIFESVFRASLDLMGRRRRQSMRVHASDLVPDGGVRVGNTAIGGGAPVLIAGPCSVESESQLEEIAAFLATIPAVKIMRGGAFKPRTSPYSFQGLREEGLEILRAVGRRHGLATVTEVLDVATLELVAARTDMLQVGSRSMYNTELLKALGRIDKPVLLKRGLAATLDELLLSAEYILAGGNERVVLCERGIRTFEPWTRNTLDIAAVPLLKGETRLPVIVDVSHALGRRDVLLPCARAALAAGADGLMIEVHAHPDQALSDGFQQLDLPSFAALVAGLGL